MAARKHFLNTARAGSDEHVGWSLNPAAPKAPAATWSGTRRSCEYCNNRLSALPERLIRLPLQVAA